MTSPVLQIPAYKLLCSQLTQAQRVVNIENQKFNKWKVPFNLDSATSDRSFHPTVTLSNIWIQGSIKTIKEDFMLVDDGTGVALVTGLSKLPKLAKSFKENDYVIVIAHVTHAGVTINTNVPLNFSLLPNLAVCAKLQAIKVADVTENKNCRNGDWWQLEVMDAQASIIDSLALMN